LYNTTSGFFLTPQRGSARWGKLRHPVRRHTIAPPRILTEAQGATLAVTLRTH
jgi:hypothetical protein